MNRVWVCCALLCVSACDDGDPSENPSATPDAAVASPDGAAADAATPEPDAAPAPEWDCRLMGDDDVDYLQQLGCLDDFQALASPPLDSTIPGARSLKSVIDRIDDSLYFQNTHRYPIHWDFASAQLSGNGRPIVPMLAAFNATEYSSPARRFLLGAITHYESSDVFAYEIAPYDTADAELVAGAFQLITANSWFGPDLYFHPTSQSVAAMAESLPDSIPVITTDELFADVDYIPLNVAESYGRLRFVPDDEVDQTWLSFRDIVVLSAVPNDISVVSGIITEGFQTPLSHINVLSKNRRTPNMSLRGAFQNEALRALDGKWVRFSVAAQGYELEEVTRAAADAWWDDNKPGEVQVPGANTELTELADIETLVDADADDLKAAIKSATRAYGGKAAHYSVLAQIEGVPSPKAFAVPVSAYFDFMATNGFDARVRALMLDEAFSGDPETREGALVALQEDMKVAPVDPAFEAALLEKLAADYAGIRMRFRSSTNAEDLDGFTGAGLYTSKSGDPGDPTRPVLDAVRKVWASVWNFRAYEERSYRSIDHLAVGMALLVHRSFPGEEANGVALTNNPFSPQGLEPAFYVNAQAGEVSVVSPDPDVRPDEFLLFFDRPGQPTTFISHSTEVPEGETVLTTAQTFELGQSLAAIRETFARAYATNGWWAMDTEFKFDGEPGEVPALFMKQARPFQ